MKPGEYTLTIHKGATLSIDIYLHDSERNPINPLSMYNKARMQIRAGWLKPGDSAENTTVRAELTTENNRLNLTTTHVHVGMSSIDTGVLAFKEGVYQLEMVNDLVNPPLVDRLLEGLVVVKGEVTL